MVEVDEHDAVTRQADGGTSVPVRNRRYGGQPLPKAGPYVGVDVSV